MYIVIGASSFIGVYLVDELLLRAIAMVCEIGVRAKNKFKNIMTVKCCIL